MDGQVRRVALYARLSVSTEESVSIDRQFEAGRQYARSRGWEIVDEKKDEGVSATKHRPEDRPGWRSLLDSPQPIDAVIVWKVDRLARNVLDFLHADEMLRGRGAGLVAVEDPIDMTDPQGRAFATMMAVFAEMEAAAISARVRASRAALMKAGRRTGGRPPFGWRNRNASPEPGYVLEKDPDRVEVVEVLVDRALAGASLYSLTKWLTETGVPTRPRRPAGGGLEADQQHANWHDASVEAILRSPVLAGMTPVRGDVLRGDDGLPVVDTDVAIISVEERRQLLAMLDRAKQPGSRPRAGRDVALLYGIVRCASCGGLMYRATAASKYHQYRCQQKGCPRPVGINRPSLEQHVVDVVLAERGEERGVTVTVASAGPDRTLLENIQAEIRLTLDLMQEDGADLASLTERLRAQKQARADAEAGVKTEPTYRVSSSTLREDWARAGDTEARRQLLLGQVEAVRISHTERRGRGLDASRVEVVWREMSEDLRARRDEQLAALARIGFRPGRGPRSPSKTP
ncbi:recombinase family protein [Nocardioides perillae]|uniref:DNA invertase Pin-like site-specific DNA recombinase n=1 Tax=Nocardioides perillae TaxID=1119534 RepID=A0A7Y9RUD8_9ACTN|nr:recombinase family protein [Nocardioides perillae]NYG56811.1 DNA invertase Pin-like site-specific DNA recombinase [Nocardioides perillae]